MFSAPNHNYGHSSACSSMPSTSTALDPSVAAMLPYDLQEVLQRNATSVLFRAVTKGGFQPFAVQLIDLNRRSRRPGFSIEGQCFRAKMQYRALWQLPSKASPGDGVKIAKGPNGNAICHVLHVLFQ
ncbi:hypothetical protein D918_08210 [Trichuris suis]|nr:hypothetical protein D918_08210 [Trichuris suis]